ncbi:MAG: GxxExxY protein [Chloroflexota bacterium]|nr:GxxExxY protein [Chloroflexota bacterium]MDE2684151.1 GxxExxY protein [Chloroflexota bacterium]
MNKDKVMLHAGLTRIIIGCAFDVLNELGPGFLESVYEKAMVIALSDAGVPVQQQAGIDVFFRSKLVGEFYADLLVDGKVIVELKAVPSALAPMHEAQLINYLNATGIPVGLLLNFGNPKLQYRRLTRSRDFRGSQD